LPIAYGHKQQSNKIGSGQYTVVAAMAVGATGAAALAVATATGTGMATSTGMATDTATVTVATTMAMLVKMVSIAMMVMMAAAWKRSVAVAEVVVTGVAMAAAMHLADYHRLMTRLS
jgi:mannose/fructose/N-acetylgalactosamine-specific phosphotransferase system component IIC